MLARMLIHVTNELMGRIVETSNSNSNLGNREKRKPNLLLVTSAKLPSKVTGIFTNSKASLLKIPKYYHQQAKKHSIKEQKKY